MRPPRRDGSGPNSEGSSHPQSDVDVAVVGAGILGLAVARALLLRRPSLRVVVLEREARVGVHQTGHNSGVIHTGVYYRPGSLKARLCVEGARALYAYCDRHELAYERCGKLIVATRAVELAALDALAERGRANGVTGLRRVQGAELAEIEPHASGLGALHVPGTGIVDFGEVARSLAAGLERRGGELVHGTVVRSLTRRSRRVVLRTGDGELRARGAIICAGGWTDTLLPPAAGRELRIVPFRGQYLLLRPEARSLVRSLIYPVPDPSLPFLGVHLSRRIDGEVLLGPSAFMAAAPDAYRLASVDLSSLARTLSWPGSYRLARRWWRTGLEELAMAANRRLLVRAAARFVPELRAADALDGPAGVRAQAVSRAGELVDDFRLSEHDGAVYVQNAPSPAATSSLALAALIAERAEPHLNLA